MTGPVDPSGLNKLLSDTMAALGDLQGESGEPPTGEGSAADGLIVVRTESPGRVTELQIDPRALRLSAERLADELTIAVNESLADLQAKARVPGGTADFSALNERLKEIQESSTRQLTSFTNQLVEAQEMLARRAGGPR